MTRWRRWGSVYIITLLFLLSWAVHGVATYHRTHRDAQEHEQAFEWSEFWINFGEGTFENWQSEFLQGAAFAILLESAWSRRKTFGAAEDS